VDHFPGSGQYLWLDLQHLVQRVRPSDQIVAVRYFTAEVRDDPDGLARQRAYLAALRARSPAVEVVLGRYQTKRMTCRQCGSAWTSYEEKETDVNIAVALVADARGVRLGHRPDRFRGQRPCPATRTARSLNPRRRMIAAFPPRRSSFEIRSLMRKPFTLAVADIRNSLLPEVVANRDGGLATGLSAW
jgi:hypothetical protein